MWRKTILLTSLLCLGGAVSSQAQQTDSHVFITDEINNSTFGDSKLSGRVKRSFSINKTQYNAFAEYNKSGKYISLPTDDNFGIVTTASQGLLTKVEVQWTNLTSNIAPVLQIYGQDYPLASYADLYADNDNAAIAQIVQDKEVVTPEGLHIQSIGFTPQYRYFGIKPAKNYVYFRNLRITWQVGYFCDEMNSGDTEAVCLPYGVSKEDMQGISAYRLLGKLEGEGKLLRLVFEKVETLSAGTPYLIRVEKGSPRLMYSGNEVAEAQTVNGMTGVLTDQVLDDGCYCILNNKVVPAIRYSTIAANHAYINMKDVPSINEGALPDNVLLLDVETEEQMGETPTLVSDEEINEKTSCENNYNLEGKHIKNGISRIIVTKGKKWMQKSR